LWCSSTHGICSDACLNQKTDQKNLDFRKMQPFSQKNRQVPEILSHNDLLGVFRSARPTTYLSPWLTQCGIVEAKLKW
jgi:hypothetical protein